MIGQCQARHRHQEFVRFLNRIDLSVDPGLIHLVLDNYGTRLVGVVGRLLLVELPNCGSSGISTCATTTLRRDLLLQALNSFAAELREIVVRPGDR